MSWVEKKTVDGATYYLNTDTKEVSVDKPMILRRTSEKEIGNWTWVPHPTEFWQPAKIVTKNDDGTTECKTEGGDTIIVPKSAVMQDQSTAGRVQQVPLWPLNKSELKELEHDLIMLQNVNDGSIIRNLRLQYAKGFLYTWVGASHRVLVSINPYQRLPLYGDDLVQKHREKSPNVDIEPHIFDIADDSYDEMLFEAKNQSILISGESGAGKTEATKQCLKFWAKVAGSKNGVEERLIQANPVLEAFGNAKTIRNNNSSRFGKWVEVYFHILERSIDGALIINYLLEKSRLVYQQSGERNFHIFYQLMADSSARSTYELKGPTENRYTQKGLTAQVNGIDDASDFRDAKKAMVDLEFSSEEQEWLLRVPAAILHLGNVTFTEQSQANNVRGSKITDEAPLKLAAKFLDLDVERLRKVLLTRSISVNKETSIIPLDPEKARAGCDSISKGVYSRLFDWLVSRCNQSLKGDTSGRFVGVLDIFGFEIFEVNSFEQLCINFCNEKLQQLFNIETFRDEELLYKSEGITYDPIKFIDSQPVLNMIEQPPKGILPLLDDEGKLPEGEDQKFMNKVEDAWKSHPNFSTEVKRRLESVLSFEITHYAGVVRYTADEFMTKNKDTFFQDAYDAMGSSSHKLTKAIFPPMDTRVQIKSLSSVFRQQLTVLMGKLQATSTRYVRCIKPNENMAPLQFDAPLVMRQLRYSGVFEAVAIRKQGYPFRYTFESFVFRFRCINYDHEYRETDPKRLAEEIIKTCPTALDVIWGKSRVLYKTETYRMLRLLRNLAFEVYVPRVQNVMRRAAARGLRARLAQSEAQLQRALDAVTDYEQLKQAVNDVDKALGSLGPKMFPGHRPRNEIQAQAHLANLQLWKNHEAVMEQVLGTDPNTNYHAYWGAREAADNLSHIPRSAKQTDLYNKIDTSINTCEVGKIDNRAVQARKRMVRKDMEACLSDAQQYNHQSGPLAECTRVLALSEREFLNLMLEAARNEGSGERQKLINMRLWQMDMSELPGAYQDYTSWSGFVNPDQYAAGWSFGKGELKAGMHFANKNGINSAMTEGMNKSDAKAISKNLCAYFEYKKDKNGPENAAVEAMTLAFKSAQGVNEIFAQVLKQTRPNETGKERVAPTVHDKAFDLLLVLLYLTAPTDEEFQKFVFSFARAHKGDQAVLAATHGKWEPVGRPPGSAGDLTSLVQTVRSMAPYPYPE